MPIVQTTSAPTVFVKPQARVRRPVISASSAEKTNQRSAPSVAPSAIRPRIRFLTASLGLLTSRGYLGNRESPQTSTLCGKRLPKVLRDHLLPVEAADV